MSFWMQLAVDVAAVLSLVLHFVGKTSPTAEKVAEVVDEAEALVKK